MRYSDPITPRPPTTPALSCAWFHAGNPSLLTLSLYTLSQKPRVEG